MSFCIDPFCYRKQGFALSCSQSLSPTPPLPQVYGAVASFPPSVVSRLGRLALQLTVEELGTLRLSELSSVAALGSISTWSTRQVSHTQTCTHTHTYTHNIVDCLLPIHILIVNPVCVCVCVCVSAASVVLLTAQLHQAQSQPAGLQHFGGNWAYNLWDQLHRNAHTQCGPV